MRRQKGNIDYEKDIEKVTDMGICFCQQKLKKNMKCFYIFFLKKTFFIGHFTPTCKTPLFS